MSKVDYEKIADEMAKEMFDKKLSSEEMAKKSIDEVFALIPGPEAARRARAVLSGLKTVDMWVVENYEYCKNNPEAESTYKCLVKYLMLLAKPDIEAEMMSAQRDKFNTQ